MALSAKQILLVIGMLATGALNTLSKKAQNNCRAPGYFNKSASSYEKTIHKFNHPWFQTFIMFLGELLCLFAYFILRWHDRRKINYLQSSVYTEIGNPASSRIRPTSINDGSIEFHNPKICHLIFIIPTLFDVFGTTLAGIGLLYVDASVWQMLRGSIIIFAGILSKIFLRRNLGCMHWTGIIVTIIGLVLVGLSSVLQTRHSHDSKVMIGICLILGSQILSASQMIIEELFIKKHNFPPLHIVGMEGTFGVMLMSVVILPVLYFIPGSQLQGSYENSLDAVYQIAQDPKLLVFSLLYMFSIAFYNFFGLAVTQSLTAVHRTLVDACRTMVVWAVGLFVYYTVDPTFGEPFDKSYGVLQVDGFMFLMIGTAFYNGLIELPCFSAVDDPPPTNTDPSYDSQHETDDDLEEGILAIQNKAAAYH